MKDETETRIVREIYLREMESVLAEYERELDSALESSLTGEEVESIENRKAWLFRLKIETRTALGPTTRIGEYEQRCDECGCDVEEVMMTLDEREVCPVYFEKEVR